MMADEKLIVDRVVNAANRWGEYNSIHDADWLDVKVVAGIDGEAREFILVTTTGGPHIEVNVTRGVVKGNWGSNSHSTSIRDNDDTLARMDEYFRMLWGVNDDY
jgi:hypothetical protein